MRERIKFHDRSTFYFLSKNTIYLVGGKSEKIEYLKMIENILVFPYMYLVKKIKMWKNRKVNRTNLLLQCYYIKTKNTKVFLQSKQWKTSIFYLPLFPPNQIDQSIEESAGVTTPFNLFYKCVLTFSIFLFLHRTKFIKVLKNPRVSPPHLTFCTSVYWLHQTVQIQPTYTSSL